MKKQRYLFSAIIVLLVAGAAYYFFGNNDNNPPSEIGAPELSPTAPLPVKVAYAHRGTLVLCVSATGYTRAKRQVPLTIQTNGVIDSLPVIEGQSVREGDLLLKLRDEELRLALAEAQEQVNQASLTYGQQRGERQQSNLKLSEEASNFLKLSDVERNFLAADSAYRRNQISEREWWLAKSEYEAAKMFHEKSKQNLLASRSGLTRALIGLQRAELNLTRTRLMAPFTGLVANLKVSAGQPVNTGAECLTLVQLDTMLIDVEVLESEAPRVGYGQQAAATFAAFPNEIFRGKVIAINPLVDVEKRVRRASIAISNRDHRLLPGLYAQVKIDAQFLTDRLLVPRVAIVLRDQRKVVFIVREEGSDGERGSEREGDGEKGGKGEREKRRTGEWESGKVGDNQTGGQGEKGTGRLLAKWCYVETGAENEEEVEVISSAFNLQPGEAVVVTNHFTMAHDTPVVVEK